MGTLQQQKEIWVLGSTGYVGAQLTKMLIQKRQEGVFPGRISTLGHRTILPWIMQHTNFFMSSLGKLQRQKFIDYPPDTVFHCARLAGKTDRSRRAAAKRGYQANVRLRAIFENLPIPPTVVYCSGTLMYGNTGSIADEEQPLSPIAYARAYEYAERPFTEEAKETILDVRTARPAWILGSDSWFEYFFYRPALASGFVPYYGDGRQQMSIISVEDCAGQLLHVSTHGSKGESYWFRTDLSVRIRGENRRCFRPRCQASRRKGIGQKTREDCSGSTDFKYTSNHHALRMESLL